MIASNWEDMPEGPEKYQMYLASREWARKRDAVMRRAEGNCERCRWNKPDHVHHMTYIRKYSERPSDLRALCRGCHEFIHNKSSHDPRSDVPFNIGGIEIESVYLAGKISGTKWRDEIVNLWSDQSSLLAMLINDEIYEKKSHAFYMMEQFPVANSAIKVPAKNKLLDFTGPYWNSDTDAYGGHGSNNYVYDIYKGTHDTGSCCGSITRLCFDAIKRSSMIFAWINSSDAHGTIQEIGYAQGMFLRTPVVVAFESSELLREMWFLAESADFCMVADSAGNAWERFCKAATEFCGYGPDIKQALRPDTMPEDMKCKEVKAFYEKVYEDADESEKEWAEHYCDIDPYGWRPLAKEWPPAPKKEAE